MARLVGSSPANSTLASSIARPQCPPHHRRSARIPLAGTPSSSVRRNLDAIKEQHNVRIPRKHSRQGVGTRKWECLGVAFVSLVFVL